MARKTNKTAHVLDLLTNGESSDVGEADAGKESEPQPQKAEKKQDTASGSAASAPAGSVLAGSATSASVSAPQKKVTVVDHAGKSDEVAGKILEKLTEELERESGTAAAAEVTETVETKAEAAEIVIEAAAGGNEAVSESVAGDVPNVPKEPETANPEKVEAEEERCSWKSVNVMQEIVKQENLDLYISQYGVCACSRCKADIAALILTSLPAKYVVVENNQASPMLSFYRSKFRIRMLTEIAKACIVVKENPRHG